MIKKTSPTPQRYWLKQHQITAFWHGFGISNGLHVPIEHVEKIKYTKGKPKEVFLISADFMREQLAKYIVWLESYAESWNSEEPHPSGVSNRKLFLEEEKTNESRKDVLKMVELLQKYRIDNN